MPRNIADWQKHSNEVFQKMIVRPMEQPVTIAEQTYRIWQPEPKLPVPHLRKCGPNSWLCTNSRQEQHILRGVAAPTPKEAYETWMRLIEIVPISQLLISPK